MDPLFLKILSHRSTRFQHLWDLEGRQEPAGLGHGQAGTSPRQSYVNRILERGAAILEKLPQHAAVTALCYKVAGELLVVLTNRCPGEKLPQIRVLMSSAHYSVYTGAL